MAGGTSISDRLITRPEQRGAKALVVGLRRRRESVCVGEHALDDAVLPQRSELLARDTVGERGSAAEGTEGGCRQPREDRDRQFS